MSTASGLAAVWPDPAEELLGGSVVPPDDVADAEREWAYDRQSHIGKLDKALDEGTKRGWTIVDMKKD